MSKINYLKVKAEYQSQLHELSQVNWGLQYSVIKAPFDGVVIAKNVAVGEQVSVNYYRDPLVSIADNDQVAVKLSLNTVDVQKISLGKKLNIVINNQKYVGKVSKISHSLLEKSKYDVLISLNVKQMVFPGKMAKVVLD
jgi:multidrug resistance efflux pump